MQRTSCAPGFALEKWCDQRVIHGARSGLTTREPSRAGLEAPANLVVLDELRRPSGGDSGEVVRHQYSDHLIIFQVSGQESPESSACAVKPSLSATT